MNRSTCLSVVLVALAFALCGCSGSVERRRRRQCRFGVAVRPGAHLPGGAAAQLPHYIRRSKSNTPIQHVVIIVQENRSFNDLFEGFPGATTASSGELSNGQSVNPGTD